MLKINNISKKYKQNEVLKNICLHLKKGVALALVGESGSGKSTLSRLILSLEKANFGEIYIENQKSTTWIKENKGAISIVFQDYRSSINPNFTIKEALQEPFWQKEKLTLQDLKKVLAQVELSHSILNSYAHELSGGQIQRVCIARALLLSPKLLILDEALNALDIYTQMQIIKLLKNLQKEKNITYLFITHDLESASALCEEIAILYKGEIVENLNINNLKNAKHFYTKALLEAVIPLI